MHHTLVLLSILGVGGDVDYNRVVLGQTGLEVCFLPLVFLVLAC